MDRYSRLVTLFKVLLPLTALALLSTMFLLSRTSEPEATIPFAEEDVANRVRNQQVTGPFFSGVTPDGDEVLFTAEAATPVGQNKAGSARNLKARVTTVDGLVFDLRSERGTFWPPDDTATFLGEVVLETSNGYTLRTQTISTRIKTIAANAPGAITGNGPLGSFTAGGMILTSHSDTGDIHMLFNNGVKLIYRPKPSER